MNVCVFGSAQPKPGDPAYIEAQHLGGLLADAGHQVVTGGYVGTMEAASRGAAEAGGHVIGVTCRQIEAYRPGGANPWVHEVWPTATLTERLDWLTSRCQAFLALPGGIGTLVEVSLAWNLLAVRAISPAPLILIGSGWQAVITILLEQQNHNIDDRVGRLAVCVPTVDAAVEALARWH
ncbi:MAG TPA: LOG family protein [Anaerolineaceae bacterium]|jgi:uncharacterized protein (TIGR00730 family)|nr:LOG family protein [Anaerolineaceae bacterium]